MIARAASVLVAFVLASVLLPPAAQAHQLLDPRRDDLRIEPAHVVVTVREELSDREAVEVRDRFDADDDGMLDAKEQDAARAFLAARTRRGVVLDVNGTRLDLVATSVSVDGLEPHAKGESHLGLVLVLEAPLRSEASRLDITFADGQARSERGVPLSVSIEGLDLVTSSAGRVEVGGGKRAVGGDAHALRLIGIRLAPATPWTAELSRR